MARLRWSPWLTGLAVGAGTFLAVRALGVRGARARAARALSKDEARRFALLVPSVQRALRTLRASLASAGVQTFVGRTHNSQIQHAADLREGRSAAEGGSWHCTGRAVDLYIIDPETDEVDTKARRKDLYAKMGAIAERVGWRWLGLGELRGPGGTFIDAAHLELREGRTIAQAMREYRMPTLV
jgi:hypothetical protein